MAQPHISPLLRWLFRLPAWLYRWNCGWILGRRFLLLIHVGRRSGKSHRTVLEVMSHRKDGLEIIVMSGFGPNADWFRNIQANRTPRIIIGSSTFIADFRVLGTQEAIGVIADYEQRNRLLAPIMRLVLSGLLAIRYRGSESDRREAAEKLPLIAFRPRKS